MTERPKSPEAAGRAFFHLDFEIALDADYHEEASMVCIKVWLDDQEPAELIITDGAAMELATRLIAAAEKSREVNG